MRPIHLDPRQRQELERRRHETPERRVYERLSAVLWVAAGKDRFEAADLLGCSVRQVAEWLRIYRNTGLDALCTLHYEGDPGKLTARQVERLKQEISAGRFRNPDQIRLWVEEMFRVRYTPSGIKDLLHRVGASYHKVTGFWWKAGTDKQHEFVAPSERQKAAAQRPGARRTRGSFVDACHPPWGLELVHACWLLVGQRFLAGMGSGRKRLNILGAYCPDDQEYLDPRLTRDNINGEQFVNRLRLLRAMHPDTERFVLYLDRAGYYGSPVVKDWLRRHPQVELERLPTYSPNLNLIERLWKFLRQWALSRWHRTFEAMQAAVAEVPDLATCAPRATAPVVLFSRRPRGGVKRKAALRPLPRSLPWSRAPGAARAGPTPAGGPGDSRAAEGRGAGGAAGGESMARARAVC